MGLTLEEASGPPFEVWPDNWASVLVFESMGTQWRTGPGGIVGLDYTPLPAVMRWRGVPRKQRAQVFDDVRVMEDAALIFIRQESKR